MTTITQENFPESMTDQEIFDHVAKHLFAQGKPARQEQACLYRVPGSLMRCAIGACIPDSEYHHNMENLPISALLDMFPIIKARFAKNNHKLLFALQRTHDHSSWASTEAMRSELEGVASRYDLSHSILQKLRFEDK